MPRPFFDWEDSQQDLAKMGGEVEMTRQKCEIGVIARGRFGNNLLLNIARRGHLVAAYNRDPVEAKASREAAGCGNIRIGRTVTDFLGRLRTPRIVMMIVSSGPSVDQVMAELAPHLDPGDMIIEAGNSYFKDTNRRGIQLEKQDIALLGVGLSGGASAAPDGPCIMVGGPKTAYERVRPILESVASRVRGEPCVAFLGPGSAGHYVKMVHNAITYALMQLVAETYDLAKQCLGLSHDELQEIYQRWNQTELNAFLVEIAPQIFRSVDDTTGKRLIDVLLREVGQKGMAKWAIEEAMELQVAVPSLHVAMAMRQLLGARFRRASLGHLDRRPRSPARRQLNVFLDHLRYALYAGMIITYSQGISLIQVASRAYGYDLNIENVVGIWRGGSIIRAALLERIRLAYRANPGLDSPLSDPRLAQELMARQAGLRSVIHTAIELDVPVPGLMVSLAFFDSQRNAWLPANLIQFQRDYFDSKRVQSCLNKRIQIEQKSDWIM